jgi:hypothetical protein
VADGTKGSTDLPLRTWDAARVGDHRYVQTMSDRVARKLGVLAGDYERVRGIPFQHFFCPVLYRDQDVELCEAHIVNKAFGASSLWTVQRKDVDGFYGSMFESEFVDLKDRGREPADAIRNRALTKRFRPKIVAAGRSIDYYMPTGPIPAEHTRVICGGPTASSRSPSRCLPRKSQR